MLKAISILAVILGLAVAGVLAYAATLPDTFRIQRSARMNAPADKIFPLINDLKAFNTWNPFAKADPSARITYSGAQNGKGAAYDWDSTGSAGKGRMEITDASAPTSIKAALSFSKPFTANNVVDFTLKPAGDATEVTWAMSGPWPFLHRVMGTVFNSDKMVGGEFEKGLAELKSAVEKK
jgi:Polyketide cyclase / dehydrase and lipid transport